MPRGRGESPVATVRRPRPSDWGVRYAERRPRPAPCARGPHPALRARGIIVFFARTSRAGGLSCVLRVALFMRVFGDMRVPRVAPIVRFRLSPSGMPGARVRRWLRRGGIGLGRRGGIRPGLPRLRAEAFGVERILDGRAGGGLSFPAWKGACAGPEEQRSRPSPASLRGGACRRLRCGGAQAQDTRSRPAKAAPRARRARPSGAARATARSRRQGARCDSLYRVPASPPIPPPGRRPRAAGRSGRGCAR